MDISTRTMRKDYPNSLLIFLKKIYHYFESKVFHATKIHILEVDLENLYRTLPTIKSRFRLAGIKDLEAICTQEWDYPAAFLHVKGFLMRAVAQK